ncbi:MAG TPA: hypothetical protein VF481_08465 [Novosphingobium sp.]
MKRIALALAAMALPGAVDAKPTQPAWPQGLYSNVRSIEDTGDLVGIEFRFYEEGGRHMVELARCEGWCNEVHLSEVTRGENGFVLHYTEMFTGSQGEVPIEVRFVVWPAGNGLRVATYQARENIDPEGKPQRLRRASRPFGIAVAKSGKE